MEAMMMWNALATKSPFDHQWILPLLIAIVLPLLSHHIIRRQRKNKVRQPPGPPRLPIIGNLHQLGKLPHQSLFRLSQTYGNCMLLHLGGIRTLVVCSAAAARDVLKTHDLDFCHRPSMHAAARFTYDNSAIAFSPYSDRWRDMRRLLVSELIGARGAQSVWSARKAEVGRLVSSLADVASSPPRAVDLNEKVLDLIQGVTEVAAFGKHFDEVKRFREVVKEATRLILELSGQDYFPGVGWVVDSFTGYRRRLERCFRSLDGYFQRVIDAHLDPTRPDSEVKDFVDLLLGLWKKGQTTTNPLTMHNVKGILWDIFIGATDTSAVSIMWAMSEMIKNPRTLCKAQAEIRSHVGKKSKVEPDDLAELKYLKMVVKETLRLHPADPLLIPHESIRHCIIGNGDNTYDILPRTRVLMNSYAIGRDPESWTRPLEFYPERFEQNDIDFKGLHFELIPFGAGRRICPGISMGIATVEFVLANLLFCFDWELPNGMSNDDVNMEEESGLVTHRKTPLYLIPKTYKYQEENCAKI